MTVSNQIGRVIEIRLEAPGETSALIECPPGILPSTGQYLQAHAPDDPDVVLPVSLFACRFPPPAVEDKSLFESAPPVPASWQPGTPLILRGPLGRGFQLPRPLKRLGLAAIGHSASRLLPLIDSAAEIALFSNSLPPDLPALVEVNPLSALPDGLAWANFFAIDCPLEQLPTLPGLLRIEADSPLPCPAQILVSTPMPCGALAECGVCALPAKRGYKLACKDGPVFEWGEIRY
jgi:dihydroorotate dehydrogenase electron transfer subunit